MYKGIPTIGLVGGVAAFGAASAVLAALGLGVPFLLAALVAACGAGLLIQAVAGWAVRARPASRLPVPPGPALEGRIRLLEDSTAHLRHDLRGVLSPALMMADRLLRNEDPAIRRAGQAVVRSIERATTLLAENKRATAATARGEPDAAATPPRSHVAGSDAPTR
ncbi:MAG: hypothetical protein NVSMB18_34280 [Acetobacteraceae bacterium]